MIKINPVQISRYLCLTLVSIFSSLLFFSEAYANKDSVQEHFFLTIQDSLVKSYRNCTKDTSEKITINEILQWKKQIDTFTSSPDYPSVIKRFRKESGLDPSGISPCEIYNWERNIDIRHSEDDQLLTEHITISANHKADSLLVLKDLDGRIKSPFDLNEIPFGITKKSLLLLAARKKMVCSKDYGNYIEYSGIKIGSMVYTAACFFDLEGKYCKYELEGRNLPLDSLDSKVRPETENLTNYFTNSSGSPPQHTYKIGRFEINQGRLAISALWITGDKKVYTGFSTYKYLYYAKAIVERN